MVSPERPSAFIALSDSLRQWFLRQFRRIARHLEGHRPTVHRGCATGRNRIELLRIREGEAQGWIRISESVK